MGYKIGYSGPKVDELLQKAFNSTVVNNGWVKYPSSESERCDLNTLMTQGNYSISFWNNGPIQLTTTGPINISITKNTADNTYYQTIYDAGKIYTRKSNDDGTFTNTWNEVQTDTEIDFGASTPVNPKDDYIWIDTSGEVPIIKIFNETTNSWVSVSPSGMAKESVYDPQGIKRDFSEFVNTKIKEADLESAADNYEKHLVATNDDGTPIHVTTEEKSKWLSAVSQSTADIIINSFSSDMSELATSKVTEKSDYINGTLTTEVNSTKSKSEDHINDSSIHLTQEQVDLFDSKASGDHKHILDGSVTVSTNNITGLIPIERIDPSVIERCYTVNSMDEIYKLYKTDIQNGDTLYYNNNGSPTAWFVINEDALGKLNFHENLVSTEYQPSFTCIAYGANNFVACSRYNSKYFAYSSDAINWTLGQFTKAGEIYSICYGNDKFVACGMTSICYSADGINWTELTAPYRVNKAVYCNGRYILAAALDTTKFLTSTDGITWIDLTIGITNTSWDSVYAVNDIFVASTDEYNAYSSDGINWTEIENPIGNKITCLTYGMGMYLAKANDNLYKSTDNLITFELISSDFKWNTIKFDGFDKFVAIHSNTTNCQYSYDGYTWNVCSLSTDTHYWFDLCYGDGKIVVIAPDVSAYYTPMEPFIQYAAPLPELTWDNIREKPTSLSEYGEDVYTQDEIDTLYNEIKASLDELNSRANIIKGKINLEKLETTDLITTYKYNLNKAIAINKKLDYMILDMNLPKDLESDLINDYKNRSIKYNDDIMIPKTINFTVNTSDGKSLDSSIDLPTSKVIEFNPLESTVYGRNIKISDLIGFKVGDIVDSADNDGYYELTSITGDSVTSIDDDEYNAEYIIPQEENEDKEYF